ncbi:alpha-ribazole phosphatase family protein [Candidatus Methylospira mobilis]|uniref:Alpha-ribazole phosphatase family protein n=1 Tax=Candidatus Methylospira mobilis TaxID=1808979 RepID=A0A5Q0BHA3_9GAMM|nr:alpha-ribazole phosphatase family protein [Candidatus Methylospira mobilis]QFY42909.1 alpha-ribazole phosphatase family protein [Candidatus Methylospira mobilis]WNV03850.1 alpha-ribazole phosphatase family protein [Candidatus Methylospira mobilis]
MNPAVIDLLRHGEVDGALCMGGECDAPLNARGWAQMRAVLPADGSAPPWNGIISSPLLRCAEFAREVAGKHNLPLEFDVRFRELGFGAWEGRSWESLYKDEGERLLAFQRNPTENPAPGGEDYPDFERRIADAWNELLDIASERHWLLLAHGGVIRVLLRLLLEIPPANLFRIDVPHASLSRLQHDYGVTRLIFHGGKL